MSEATSLLWQTLAEEAPHIGDIALVSVVVRGATFWPTDSGLHDVDVLTWRRGAWMGDELGFQIDGVHAPCPPSEVKMWARVTLPRVVKPASV